MSRIIVYDLNNNPAGEFKANINRGWILLGNPGVEPGGTTTVDISNDVASQPFLQLGRLVLVDHPKLPPWIGVIDTPWKAASPCQLTIYNAEYLFSLRAAERSVAVTGPLSASIIQMIQLVNEQEETYITPGNMTNMDEEFSRAIEQKNIWDQMMDLLQNSGYEMLLRPQRDVNNRLSIFADVGKGLGVDTGYLLHDGDRGNMRVVDAAVNGKITNRVIGVSGQTTEEAQLQSDLLENQASQNLYRTRSEVVEFQNITQPSVLDQYTQTYLDATSYPYLDLSVEIFDVDQAFANARPGNWVIVHAAGVYLPGGVHGWRGNMRILAMAYDEGNNVIGATLRGTL